MIRAVRVLLAGAAKAARAFFWVTLLATIGPAAAQTNIGGSIVSSATWRAADGPFIITGAAVVQNNAIIEVEAGTQILFAPGASLAVQSGSLRTNGTTAQRVLLTSQRTQSSTAAPGDWSGLTIGAASIGSRLDYTDIDYGTGVSVFGASLTLNHARLRFHQGAALRIDLAASLLGVGNEATNNQSNAVSVPAGEVLGSVQWLLRGIPFHVASGTVSVGAAPRITNVAPSTLIQGQTAEFSISGTRLGGAARITLDATGVTGEVLPGGTDSQVQVRVNASGSAVAGATSLTLLTDAGEASFANALVIQPTQPRLDSLSPSSIVAGQGDVQVTLIGQNITAQSVAVIGSTNLASTFVGPTRLIATVPNQTGPGSLLLQLRTPDPAAPGQYFTSNGLSLGVTAPVLALSPANPKVIKGQAQTFTLTLPYAAPSGGWLVNLSSSVPSVGTVPPSVLVPAGSSIQTFQFTAVDTGTTIITASRAGFGSSSTSAQVIAPPTLTITPSSFNLGVDRTATFTVNASAPADAGGLALSVNSGNTVVATIASGTGLTIPEGASSALGTVRGVALGQTNITASATGFVAGTASVSVRPVSLVLPTAALVAPGLGRSIPITLSDPAPAGGLAISFASSNPAVVAAPADVVVPEGQTAINITINGAAVGNATLTASAAGYQSGAVNVLVEAVTIGLGVSTVSVPQGLTAGPYTVSISRPAPAGGVTVALVMTNTATATVSLAEVFIPEGQTSAPVTRPVISGVLKGSTVLTLSAAGLTSRTVTVTVTDPISLRFWNAWWGSNIQPMTIGKGFRTYSAELQLHQLSGVSSYNGPQPVTVTLTSSDPSKVRVPATVTIPAGTSAVGFDIEGVDLTSGTPVTIDATVSGYGSPTTKLTVSVVAPIFGLCGAEATRTTLSARDDITLCTTYQQYNGTYYPMSPANPLTVDWSVVEDSPAGLIPGFFNASSGGTAVTQTTWAAGAWNGAAVWTATPTAVGSYKVRGSLAGLNTATSGVVTVAAPSLRFNSAWWGSNVQPMTIGKGFKTYSQELSIQQLSGSTAFNATQPVTVSLTSSDPSKVTVPATVTIPAGGSSVVFDITGVELTAGTPVTIDATVSGYTAPAVKLTVSVVAPIFGLCGTEATRTVLSPRDDVTLCTTYQQYTGTYYPMSPAAPLTVDWTIVDDTPGGLVPGFFSAASGGTAVLQTTWNAGSFSWNSAAAWVATPASAGTYKVRGTVAGLNSATSGAVTVSAPALRFNSAWWGSNVQPMAIGKGFRTYQSELSIQQLSGSSALNGAQPVTVTLTSSDPTKVSVPATVIIPAGTSAVAFEIVGVDLTAGTPVTIDASVTGYSSPATKLTVSVVPPVFGVCGSESTRTVVSPRDDVNACATYQQYSGTYYPMSPAAALTVEWTVVDDSPVGLVPGFFSESGAGAGITQTTWAAGGGSWNSGSAWVATPTAAGTYKVRGSIAGLSSATGATVTVSPPALRFTSAWFGTNPSSVTIGRGLRTYSSEMSVQRTSGASGFNGTEPVTVNLACTSTAICRVPATVTIPAGANAVTFQVEGVELGSTTITAWATGYTSPPDLPVATVAPTVNFSNLGGVAVGQTRNVQVYLCVPNSGYSCNHTALSPIGVDLVSSAPGVATVPATTTIPTGATYSGAFPLTGVSAGQTTITASGVGLQSGSGTISVTP